jgi:hypothetical protein
MKKFRIIYQQENELFNNFNLTELCLIKNDKRKSLGSKHSIYLSLPFILKDTGITFLGSTILKVDSAQRLEFRHIIIDPNTPVENLFLIDQLYGYTKGKINITLFSHADYEVAFDYDLNTKHCYLQKHVYGTVQEEVRFSSILSMFEKIKEIGFKSILGIGS